MKAGRAAAGDAGPTRGPRRRAPLAWPAVLLRLARHPTLTVPECEPVELAPRDAALLAWLALEGPTPRARLASLLWPDSGAEAARNVLRQRLFQLKRLCGAALVGGSAVLALAEGVAHDLDDADEVLADLDGAIGAEFDAWLVQQRERRRGRLRDVLAELAERAEQARDWPDALGHAHELLALDAHSEAAHRRLMRLHYLAGDRAAALLAFDACERMLKDEVGARPSAETLALLATIERAAPGVLVPAGDRVPAAVLRPPQLVGRVAERAAAAAAIEARALLLLRGDAGMGKSRLLDESVHCASAQGWVVTVGARPGDAALPHGLATRLLRALLAHAQAPAEAGARAALARLLPELGSPDRQTDEAARPRLYAAAQALLAAAVAAGLQCIAVDDLQFADDASLALLQALLGEEGCAWLLAARPDELSPQAQALVETQAAAARWRELTLAPLDVAAIGALLETLALPGIGGAAQAEALHRRTGGNPLYLLETIKAALAQRSAGDAAAQPWPRAETVQRLIQQRLARLSPAALKLARCAAIAGPDLSAPLAAQVLGQRPLDLADAWAELERAQVLQGGAFTHDLVAEAARAAVALPIARSLHAEIAVFVEQARGEPARIAEHWLGAGEPRRAVPHLQAVARQAEAAWQPQRAGQLHEQVAAILGAAGDRAGAAQALLAAAYAWFDGQDGARLQAAADALEALADDDDRRAMVLLVRAAMQVMAGDDAAADATAARGLACARRAGAADLQVELLWTRTVLQWERREIGAAIRGAEEALVLLDDPATQANARVRLDDAPLRFAQLHGIALSSSGRFVEGVQRMEGNHAHALRLGQPTQAGMQALALALTALECGDGAAALRWAEQARLNERFLTVPDQALMLRWHAAALAAGGQLGGALAVSEQALERAAAQPSRHDIGITVGHALLLHTLGRRDLALRALAPLRALTAPTPQRGQVEAAWIHVGGEGGGDALLGQAAAFDDIAQRVRTLVWLQPGCRPEAVLPLLTISATALRDGEGWGLYVEAQAARVAALRALGRAAEARSAALALWAALERGVVSAHTFPALAAEAGAALVDAGDADLAQAIALRASAWMQQAAATLPPGWRENYLARAPVLERLRAPRGGAAPALPSR